MNGNELAVEEQAPKSDHGAAPHLFEPDVLLPAQFFRSPPGMREIEEEKRLIVAILADAIGCFQKYATANHRRGQRLFAEAAQWIFEEDDAWVFSFESICALLRLNAPGLRQALLQWKARKDAAPATEPLLRRMHFRTRRPHRVAVRPPRLRSPRQPAGARIHSKEDPS